jgi:hypothetical protein
MLVMSFTGSYFVFLGLLPELLPNLIVIACALLAAMKWRTRSTCGAAFIVVPGRGWLLMLLAVTLFSGARSGEGALQILLFSYNALLFYVVLLMLANSRLDSNDYWFFALVVIGLSLIQTPVAAYRLMDMGWSIKTEVYSELSGFGSESASGTFGSAMGTMGTLFPLAAIGVALSLAVNGIIRRRIFVLLLLWFVVFAFLVGKRAFPLVLPVYLAIAYYFLYRKSNRLATLIKAVLLTLPIAMFLVFLSAKLHPSMNPERQVWGSFDLDYIYHYVIDYESGESYDGSSTGRLSSTLKAVGYSIEHGFVTLFIGKGPGTLVKSGVGERKYEATLEEIGITYGVSGALWTFVQLGVIGLVAMSGLLIALTRRAYSSYRRSVTCLDRAWYGSVLALGIVLIMDFFFYSRGILTPLSIVFAVGVARCYVPTSSLRSVCHTS